MTQSEVGSPDAGAVFPGQASAAPTETAGLADCPPGPELGSDGPAAPMDPARAVWRKLLRSVAALSGAKALLAIVLLVATIVRLGFAFRPPPFLTPDSQGYYLPGWELAHGLGFGPELRRTPGYPLFIALAVVLFGDDLRGLVLAQHGLGVLTAGLTFQLGMVAFGRLAGLLAGIGVSLAGPLLIYEHYVLTEALFTPVLTLGVLLCLLALRRPSPARLFLAGLGLAAAILVRPVAYILLPLVPLALLASNGRSGGRAVSLVGAWAWFGLGAVALLTPWMVRNAITHGTFSAEGALGQALIGRTVRHDDSDRFYRCPAMGDSSDQRMAAIEVICEAVAAAGEEAPSGGGITQELRDRLGLSQAQASQLLRQVAVEAIVHQPWYYLVGSLRKSGEILVGKRETVLAAWRERTTRNWDNKWDPRLVSLVKGAPAASGPDYEPADALTSFFQPWRWNRQLALLLGVGLAALLLRRERWPGLIVALAAAMIVLASAALDGNVWRYRYPVDPLLAVTIGVGAQAVAQLGKVVLLRWTPLGRTRQAVVDG